MKRYVLRRIADQKYYNPRHRNQWNRDPHTAKLYTSSGHPRLAVGKYIPWHTIQGLDPAERHKELARLRRAAFDSEYEVLVVHVDVNPTAIV